MTADDSSRAGPAGPEPMDPATCPGPGLGGRPRSSWPGGSGVELVSHGVLPGKQELDQLDGACSVAAPHVRFATVGRSMSGTFSSAARRRRGRLHDRLAAGPRHRALPCPWSSCSTASAANHTNALTGMRPAQAVALEVDGRPLPPMAMVTVDGGGGYWNPHPGDDPMAMVVDELIPMCQRHGPRPQPAEGSAPWASPWAATARCSWPRSTPTLFRAVAAISPAIWTSYEQAHAANPGAYASAADFAADDAVTHAGALAGTPVRVASGDDDPFHPGVVALAQELPTSARVVLSQGCHRGTLLHRPGAAVAAESSDGTWPRLSRHRPRRGAGHGAHDRAPRRRRVST